MASVTATARAGPTASSTRAITDRTLLRAFLERDRLLAAYAICDLEDREFGKTRWGGAFDGDRLVALALEYSGLTPQPLFVMGSADGIEAILRDVIRPRAAYVAVLPERSTAVETPLPPRPGTADGPDVGRPGARSGRTRPTSGGSCRSTSAS